MDVEPQHGGTGDLSLAPETYPGTPISAPTLVLPACLHLIRPRPARSLARARTVSCPHCVGADPGGHPCLSVALRRVGARPLGRRTAVVAVGSNASAAVTRHKLSSHGVSPVVPMVTGVVRNLAVVHSAHVSRGGYVPAAPMHSPGACTAIAVQFLDDDQLAVVDATEPNYERIALDPAHHPLVLAGGRRPIPSWIYATRRGVLRAPDLGTSLLAQADLWERLRARDPEGVHERADGGADHLSDLASPHGLIRRR